MIRSLLLTCSTLLTLETIPTVTISAQSNGNVDYNTFVNPGNESRPHTWWHWINGNITEDGIRKDIEWFHRVGLGGVHAFDAGLASPQIVANRMIYMTPEWKQCFNSATSLLSSYGMELGTANSPGWSQAGGPWVQPQDAMKKLVWRETRIAGGKTVRMKLPEPFKTSCFFQNAKVKSDQPSQVPEYYQDIAVIAYKISDDDKTMAEMKAQVTSSNGHFTMEQLSNNDYADFAPLQIDSTTHTSYINITFPEVQNIKAISLTTDSKRDYWSSTPPYCCRSLEYSADGNSWTKIVDIPDGGVECQTVSFPAVKARYFRVAFHDPKVDQMAALNNPGLKSDPTTQVSELVLHTVTQINHSEEKAGYYAAWDTEKCPTPDSKGTTDVIDITRYMNAQGELTWKAPAGRWKILRFGYSLTGKENSPASPEATGLEVDKMDSAAVHRYEDVYLSMYKDATGNRLGQKGLGYIVTDSYEAYQNNWTPSMPQEFEKRRGYALWKWLPVLTGAIVEDSEKSEAFLWDWRQTIGELEVENYYEELSKILKRHGMKRYSESQENGRVYMADGMAVKRNADIPMSAMWVNHMGQGTSNKISEADIRESASVAHLYGQKLVAAESLTTVGFGCAWAFGPKELRPTADLEFASGLNRVVIHESALQPADDKLPGIGLFIFGTWFNRNITWASQAKAWTDYLARTSYMMQQGKNVADIAYYYGEDNNITGLISTDAPVIPKGYNYDYVNADALLTILNAENKNLVSSRTGATYRVLALGSNCNRMSMKVLRKLDRLSQGGVTICGDKPTLKGGMEGTYDEFRSLANAVWSRPNVISGRDINIALDRIGLKPDFQTDKDSILFVHHTTDNGEFYWIDNRSDKAQQAHITLRTGTDVRPQIWRADFGTRVMHDSHVTTEGNEMTVGLNPNESYFIVFDKTAAPAEEPVDMGKQTTVLDITTPWKVTFQEQRGAPASATFDTLASWTDNTDEGIKYFSGTATYANSFKLSKKMLKHSRALYLDLGEVGNIAEVSLNGQNLGTFWETPFLVPITHAVKAGENTLTIKVTNFWTNRIIGDMQPGTTKKYTWTAIPFYQPNSPLLRSGLIGPVKVNSINQ